MLNCKQMAELSTDYLEGKLSFWQKINYYIHLWMCPPCENYRDQVAMTARSARLSRVELEQESDPPEVPEGLMDSFRSASREGD